MFTISHRVEIKTDPQSVYRALSSADGISGWWSRTEGEFEAGGEIAVHFDASVMTLQVLQQNPTKIVWQCLQVEPEWEDTQILFEWEEQDGRTLVHFRHEMWAEETPLFERCSAEWAGYLLSLKDLLETGQGRPYPDNARINSSQGGS